MIKTILKNGDLLTPELVNSLINEITSVIKSAGLTPAKGEQLLTAIIKTHFDRTPSPIDTLLGVDGARSLSSKQGKILKGLIDDIASGGALKNLDGSRLTNLPISHAGGRVMQIVQTERTTHALYLNPPNGSEMMRRSIKPFSRDSRVLINVNLSLGRCEMNGSGFALKQGSRFISTAGNYVKTHSGKYTNGNYSFIAATSYVQQSTTFGISMLSFSFVDEPSTTRTIAYQVVVDGRPKKLAINRAQTTNTGTAVSTLILTEFEAPIL